MVSYKMSAILLWLPVTTHLQLGILLIKNTSVMYCL